MPSFAELDAITTDSLRATGGLRWAEPDVVGAFVAETDYGVPPCVTDALRHHAEHGPFGYLPRHLVDEMAAATAAFHERRYGWSVDPARVRPAPDVLTIFEVVLRHLAAGSTKVVIPTPAYMPFLLAPRMLGVEVVEVPMLRDDDGAYRYDLDGIDRAFTDGARLVMHCDPHNPTGRVFTRPELEALAEVVTRHDARVFADHVWAPLAFGGHEHVPYASLSSGTARHTLTATSASKAWNAPGLKAAQVVLTSDDDVRRWAEVGLLAEHATATPGVVAATAAYRDGEPWLDDVLAYVERNARTVLDVVTTELPDARMPVPESTYLAWLDLSAYGLRPDPARHLREHARVQLTPGTACGAVGEGHVRLVHAMPRPVLLDVLERVVAAVRA